MSQPIRITFVEPSLGAYRVPLFRGLAARDGIDLKLYYATSGRPNAKPEGFKAELVERKTYRVLGAPVYWQQSQLDAVDPLRTDVVCFDWDVHYASLVPALLKARRQGVATMLFGHGTSKNDGTWKASPRYALARLADVLVTYSIGARQAYLDRDWPVERVFAAPNALDLDAIDAVQRQTRSDPENLRRFRESKGLGNGPVLLFVARLDPPRRVDVLLEAISHLDRTYPDLSLAIVGEGPSRDELKTLATRLGIAGRVHFVGALYDEAELAKWFCAADLFAFPSFMGLSALHALGYGLPIVTGNDRWAHGPEVEAVVDGETGLLFEHNQPLAMAQAIQRLLTDTASRRQMSERGRALAHERYSMSAMTGAFENAIRAAARFADT